MLLSQLPIPTLFYESLDLGKGDKLLEIGTGSGYGASLAKEVVGEEGQVYSIEIDEITYKFGRRNLRKAGYQGKVKIIKGDGSKGYPHRAPFNKIAVTASVNHVPGPSTWPLLKQLKMGGKPSFKTWSFWRRKPRIGSQKGGGER